MTDLQSPPPSTTAARMPGWAIAALVLVVVLVVIMVIGTARSAGTAVTAGSGAPYTVTVDGAGAATIALDEDGATSQQTAVTLPYSATVGQGTRIVSVVAQLTTDAPADLSCTITDSAGNVLKSARSSGQYVTASCATALGQ